MRDQRIIKKYPNRRLYDSAQSRYVTLADIRKLVMQRVRFDVIDQSTAPTSLVPCCCRLFSTSRKPANSS